MKKTLLSIITLLLFIILIVPLMLPSQFQVERSIEISQQRDDVYSRIVNLESWTDWSPWYAQEPTAEIQFEGVPGVVGSRSSWEGKIIGSGQQTLVKLLEPEYIETELVFTKPNASKATGYWKLSENKTGTMVVWGIKGDLDYPIGRIFGLFMDEMIGPDFETGLDNLKKVMEEH